MTRFVRELEYCEQLNVNIIVRQNYEYVRDGTYRYGSWQRVGERLCAKSSPCIKEGKDCQYIKVYKEYYRL
jgi:hypothetical protein